MGHNTEHKLTVNTDMTTIVQIMSKPESGLEIRDRTWLKISIPNAFIGGDVVDWLLAHVEGFHERRDAHKYASRMLKSGYIRHTVKKNTFSEQCYYVFASDFIRSTSSISNISRGIGCKMDSAGTTNGGSSGTVTTIETTTTMMSALKLNEGNLSGTECGSLPPPPSTFSKFEDFIL